MLMIGFIIQPIIIIAQDSQLAYDNSKKETSILDYRDYFSKNSYRGNSLKTNKTLEECITLLNDNGVFTDLKSQQDDIVANELLTSEELVDQDKVGLFITEAYNRLWRIAKSYRGKSIDVSNLTSTQIKLFKGYLNYGTLEANRSNDYRFHASCFAIPTAAINSYFSLLGAMDEIEKDNTLNTLVFEANTMLKKMGMQSWTHPLRNDSTDDNVVQVERFRNHVWWVGGNALGYRSLLPAAFMMKSVPMVDVVAEVSQKALSSVSQNTYDTAFWTRRFYGRWFRLGTWHAIFNLGISN